MSLANPGTGTASLIVNGAENAFVRQTHVTIFYLFLDGCCQETLGCCTSPETLHNFLMTLRLQMSTQDSIPKLLESIGIYHMFNSPS